PVLSPDGSTTAWYLLLTDIEERKRTEAQIEQAYVHLAEAQRLSRTGSFVSDLLMDDHDFSDEAFRIFEFDRATKIKVERVRDVVHAEDRPAFDAALERCMLGEEFDLGFRIRSAGGNSKYLHAQAHVIRRIDGRPLFIGAIRDVTETKLAEQAL